MNPLFDNKKNSHDDRNRSAAKMRDLESGGTFDVVVPGRRESPGAKVRIVPVAPVPRIPLPRVLRSEPRGCA